MENSFFNNRTGLNKVRTEWKCLKTIIVQAQIKLYRVENFLKKNKRTYAIIRNLRVVEGMTLHDSNVFYDRLPFPSIHGCCWVKVELPEVAADDFCPGLSRPTSWSLAFDV